MAHTDDSHSAQSIQCAICSARHSLAHPYDKRLSNKGCCVVISWAVLYQLPVGERERANRHHHTLLCLVAKHAIKSINVCEEQIELNQRKNFNRMKYLAVLFSGQFSLAQVPFSIPSS